MSVPAGVARTRNIGTGSTGPFAFNFVIYAATHLKVVKTSLAGVDTVLALTTDYSVTLATDFTSASLTLVVPLVGTGIDNGSSEILTITRDPPIAQPTKWPRNDPFPSQTHERAADLAVMMIGRLSEQIGRSLVLPESSPLSGLTLPEPDALSFLRWNGAGTALENADIEVLPVGSVSLPPSATDNALVRWNGTDGKSFQNSNAVLDDAGNLSIAGSVAALTGNVSAISGVFSGNLFVSVAAAITGALTVGSNAGIIGSATIGGTTSSVGKITGLADGELATNLRLNAGYLDIAEIASPANPAADRLRIFAKDVNGATLPFYRDNAGVERIFGGGQLLLASGTVAAAATLPVVWTPWQSLFRSFILDLELSTSNDGDALVAQTSSNGGGVYDGGGTDYQSALVRVHANGAATAQVDSEGGQTVARIMLAHAVGNAAAESANIRLRIQNPSNTTKNKLISVDSVYFDAAAATNATRATNVGARLNTAAIDALRVLAIGGGSITGNWALYGVN